MFVFALVCSCTNLLLNLAHLRSLCKCPKSKIGFPILDYNKKTSRDSFSCSNSPIPSMRETKQKNTYETGTSVLTLSRGTSGTSCQADQGGHMSFTAPADDSYLCWLWRSAAGRPRFPDGSGQSMEWTGSIRWIHNPVQSRRIWIGLDQKFTNSADSGLDWIEKCATCIPYLEI